MTVFGTVITYFVNPDLKGIMESLGNSSSDQLKESTGIEKVWAYVVNNGFTVPLQMFVLTLIPSAISLSHKYNFNCYSTWYSFWCCFANWTLEKALR